MEYMKELPDSYFDLAIVDPPYFSGPEKRKYYGKSIGAKGVKRREYPIDNWQGSIPGYEYYRELLRVSRNQIIWGINYFEFAGSTQGRIVWDKCNGKSTFSDCEIASCSIHDSVRMFKYLWNGMMQGKSIRDGAIQQGDKKQNEKRIHATQKPVNLYKALLDRYATAGDLILDTHMGSGSLAIACHDLGYSFIGIEINEEHYHRAMKRLKNHLSQLCLF